MNSLRFLGAADVVTGSKHLLTWDDHRVLVDCGLFQGQRQWRERNWQDLPVPVQEIEAVVLTHAHLDHTGYLPRLERQGFGGPVYASEGTAELCAVVLPDSGRLQEEDAAFHNRAKSSRHTPALPLYTEQDALNTLKLLRPVALEQPTSVAPGISLRFHRAAHILGSCFADFQVGSGAATRRIVFTGDLGRLKQGSAQTLSSGPSRVNSGAPVDYLVMESTYGNREHPDVDPTPAMAAAVNAALQRGGSVVIPAFAVERTQKLLFLLKQMMVAGQIPQVPIHIDSPMAIKAIDIFLEHTGEFNEPTQALIRKFGSPHQWQDVYFDQTPQQSKAINNVQRCIIISSSGMAAGGRVLHHLANRLPDPRNLVFFVGYQSPGTLGQLIKDGKNPVLIHKQPVPVRAQIAAFEQFSDHADADEILTWLRTFSQAPRCTYLVHGEPDSAAALAARIEKELGWNVQPAHWLQEVPLE